jgi:S1-C subfamily serine protease
MQQGDIIRGGVWVAAAGVGAGLALAGAALTGHLDASTTIQQISSGSPQPGGTTPSSGSGDLSVEQIYRLDSPGVVRIDNSGGRRSTSVTGEALGSGFVIDKAGHIVTSNRVISGAPGLRVSFSGAHQLDARLIGQDPATDVAVLQVAAHSRSFSPLPLGDSDQVQVGDPVVAIGNTLSLDRTATVGIVSAVQHGIDASSSSAAHTIQTDAAINDENSGGPLINARGQVIGLSSQLETRVTGSGGEGIGFAIPIDTVKTVVAQLLATGKVQHAFLGIDVQPVDTALARAFALPCDYGLMVQAVTQGTGAASAGLEAGRTSVLVAGESYLIGGDIIVAANGTPVASESQLRDVIETMKPGDRLALRIWRGDKERTVHVKLGQPPG